MALEQVLGLTFAGVVLVVAFILAKIIHLIVFHPLARFPGPILAKFTNAYAAYHGWKGDIHLDMFRCHQIYGDHVRYGPNQLLINTEQALQDIHGTGAGSKFIKGNAYSPLVHRSPNTLTIRGGKDHARRRRILAQGVSEKAQRGYENRIIAHINCFCDAMFNSDVNPKDASTDTRSRDMSDWCYYLSFDIMSDIVFGARYNLLQSKRFRYVTQAIDASNVRMSTLIQFPALSTFKFDHYLFPNAIKARNRFVQFVSRVVKERIEAGKAMSSLANNDADVFAQLATAKDPDTGQGFQNKEIAAESTTLIVAGSDTSSTALSGLFFYLATNRVAYTKAAAEVRDVFSSRDEIQMGAKLASCIYLRACVDESLRMAPPVGSALWREVLPGGAVVDGIAIPGGCEVGVSIYAIHHQDKYYIEPYKYRPERWLVEDVTGSIQRARSAFNPFSVGIRGCLGKGLAVTELLLTIATVLWDGEFELASGKNGEIGRGRVDAPYGRHRVNEYQLWDHVTAQKHGPVLRFSRR